MRAIVRYSAKISLFSALSKVKALKRTTLPFNLKFKLSLIVTVKAKFKCISSTDCGNLVCLQLHSGNARDMKYSIAIEPTTVIPASGSVFFPQEPAGKTPFPAETVQKNSVSCRKTPYDGSSIPTRKCLDFSGDFCRFPAPSVSKRLEVTGKHPKISGWEYCFHKIPGSPWNRSFPCRILWPGPFAVTIHSNWTNLPTAHFVINQTSFSLSVSLIG